MYPKPVDASHRAFRNALTVTELMEMLSEMPGDARVAFICDYGDYCHTQQLLPVTTCEVPQSSSWVVEESAYSKSGLAIAALAEDEEREDEDQEEGEYDETGENLIVVLNLVQ